jgi:drug/metabolite transporter (DMT)-like permease
MQNMKIDNIKGMIFMVINALSLAALYATMKFVTSGMSSNQAVFFYKIIILVCIIPWVFYKDGLSAIKTPNFKIHLCRSFFSVSGTLSFMYAIKSIKLVDITAMTHLEQVIWLAVGVIFFNESFTKAKLICIIIGFIGGFIIVKPELFQNLFSSDVQSEVLEFNTAFNTAYIFVAITVACWTINSSLVKVLGYKKATNKAQLFYAIFFAALFAYLAGFIDWQASTIGSIQVFYPGGLISPFNVDVELWRFGFIALASLFYLIHNMCFFNALKYGEMTVIAPFVYFKLTFAGTLGYFFFGELPRLPISYLGYAMIIGSGIFSVISQYRHHQRLKAVITDTEN